MSMEQLDKLAGSSEPLLVSPEVFQQLGTITRTLHDTMQRLGVMPKLQVATDGLPDARSRLNYIATKTAAAADKVLNSVDQAKAEHAGISAATKELAAALVADPVRAVASGAVMNFVKDVEARTASIDAPSRLVRSLTTPRAMMTRIARQAIPSSLTILIATSTGSLPGSRVRASAMFSGPFLYFHSKWKGPRNSCHRACLAERGLMVVEKKVLGL